MTMRRFAKALGSILKASGFRVGSFSSAEEYLTSSDGQNSGCLILDVRLPGMSGIEPQYLLCPMGDEMPIVFGDPRGSHESGGTWFSDEACASRCAVGTGLECVGTGDLMIFRYS